jgi:hypothetical protein
LISRKLKTLIPINLRTSKTWHLRRLTDFWFRLLSNCFSKFKISVFNLTNFDKFLTILQKNIFIITKFDPKIRCPCKVRVNLPHIDNKEYFQFVLQQNLINRTKDSTFLSRNLCVPLPLVYQISKFGVRFFVPGPQHRYQKCCQIWTRVNFSL